jgi:DNA helicase-2/ATP-dependent DNA helicase PcrA
VRAAQATNLPPRAVPKPAAPASPPRVGQAGNLPQRQAGLFGGAPTPVAPKRPAQTGTVVEHPKYGKGTIVRREGEGEDAKVVVSFARHGLKKLVEKYAGLKRS